MNLPDWTFFYQLGIFLLSILVLHTFLFKPMLKVFEARERAYIGPKTEAEQIKSEAEILQEKISASLQHAREEADKIRAEAQKTATVEESQILTVAKKESLAVLGKAKADLDAHMADVKKQVAAEASNLARDLVTMLLSVGVRRQS